MAAVFAIPSLLLARRAIRGRRLKCVGLRSAFGLAFGARINASSETLFGPFADAPLQASEANSGRHRKRGASLVRRKYLNRDQCEPYGLTKRYRPSPSRSVCGLG